jgi:hypothetical protein
VRRVRKLKLVMVWGTCSETAEEEGKLLNYIDGLMPGQRVTLNECCLQSGVRMLCVLGIARKGVSSWLGLSM